MSGLVSICLPVYNAEKTLGKTIASILTQTYTNIELIIVDNNSTDKSIEIVRSFTDPRIRIIQYNIHVPYAELNWDRCFQYARGDHLAIFHADDIYLPDMVKRQVETLWLFPEVAGVFTSGTIINDNDDKIGEFNIPEEVRYGCIYTYQELLTAFLIHADFLPTPSAMIRTGIYKGGAPFRYSKFKSAADMDMWLRIAQYGGIILLNEKLFNYRVSSSQGSNQLNKLRTRESDYFKVIDFHLAQNKVSEEARISYELSRFGDQLLCQMNFLRKYGIQALFNPKIILDKIKMYRYFKVFRK